MCQKLAAGIAGVQHALIVALGRTGNRRRIDVALAKEQRAQRLRSVATVVGRVLAVAVLTAALGYGAVRGRNWMLTSPFFGLSRVEAVGHVRVTPAEIKRLGGLARGLNLFQLDPAAIERGIGAHPWVKEVELRRRYPSTVSVRIVEHVPAAVLALHDLYLVDGEGHPFKRLQPGDDADLPLITGIERETYAHDPEAAGARIREALAAIHAYREAGLESDGRISEAHLAAAGLTLVTGKGQELRLPDGDVTAALGRLVRIRRELVSRDLEAEIIHLDNRARPGWVAIKVPAPVSEKSQGRQ